MDRFNSFRLLQCRQVREHALRSRQLEGGEFPQSPHEGPRRLARSSRWFDTLQNLREVRNCVRPDYAFRAFPVSSKGDLLGPTEYFFSTAPRAPGYLLLLSSFNLRFLYVHRISRSSPSTAVLSLTLETSGL